MSDERIKESLVFFVWIFFSSHFLSTNENAQCAHYYVLKRNGATNIIKFEWKPSRNKKFKMIKLKCSKIYLSNWQRWAFSSFVEHSGTMNKAKKIWHERMQALVLQKKYFDWNPVRLMAKPKVNTISLHFGIEAQTWGCVFKWYSSSCTLMAILSNGFTVTKK